MIHPCPKQPVKPKKKKAYNHKGVAKMLAEKGIRGCEIKFSGCKGVLFPTFAHRHKRNWYLNRGNLINDFGQIVFACASCHGIIEQDAKLTAEVFNRLRGSE